MKFIGHVATRIINEVSKPPGTIEWE